MTFTISDTYTAPDGAIIRVSGSGSISYTPPAATPRSPVLRGSAGSIPLSQFPHTSNTRRVGSALRRLASKQPALPAPMMTKSKVGSVTLVDRLSPCDVNSSAPHTSR